MNTDGDTKTNADRDTEMNVDNQWTFEWTLTMTLKQTQTMTVKQIIGQLDTEFHDTLTSGRFRVDRQTYNDTQTD